MAPEKKRPFIEWCLFLQKGKFVFVAYCGARRVRKQAPVSVSPQNTLKQFLDGLISQKAR